MLMALWNASPAQSQERTGATTAISARLMRLLLLLAALVAAVILCATSAGYVNSPNSQEVHNAGVHVEAAAGAGTSAHRLDC
jgi:hypothetical protein